MSRRLLVAAGAAVLVAVTVLVLAFRGEPVHPYRYGVSDDDRTVTVEFIVPGDSCGGVTTVDWSVSDEEVRVEVRLDAELRWGTGPCLPIGLLDTARLRLGEPLGGRPVVDATTDATIPRTAR